MSSSSSSDDSDEDIIPQILINLPRPRRFRDRSNPLQDYDDLDFKCRFRLSKETFMILLHMIGDSIKHRSSSLSPVLQLLIALRYYATGAFQMVLGDHIQVHKSTVYRVIKTVSTEIARLRPHFIEFPSTVAEQRRVQLGFFRLHQFPRVIGALDCTHIRIQSPKSDIGEQFRNRKGWPGSVHDSTIFDNSLIRAKFENNEFGNTFLLGDGGYPCRNYHLTPLLNPRTEAERKYQKAQIGSRNVVEGLFGVLKRRFPVLAVGIRTKLSTTMATIVATAVLYNFLLKEKDEIPQEIDNHLIDIELLQEIPTLPIRQLGNAERSHLINTVFS
ncbi:putative nuclease HARBI1 [Acyrthosiphon pisum]|uniref:DDE Tnp4 domain-containing protein n=1 Tax=Acyrthosiphon pisum TaxID=7029 RepID=A0A8R1W405_ACYPI|nr:putative nuclease HARBI1 [Acyrthosiphon pisum]|eukprot:XP_001951909.1 PREDICTED: putative nuclease HARBI1 [Acyrthosiphon pisum]